MEGDALKQKAFNNGDSSPSASVPTVRPLRAAEGVVQGLGSAFTGDTKR